MYATDNRTYDMHIALSTEYGRVVSDAASMVNRGGFNPHMLPMTDRYVSAYDVAMAVCGVFGVHFQHLVSDSRSDDIMPAKHAFRYIWAYVLGGKTDRMKGLARGFDHSTFCNTNRVILKGVKRKKKDLFGRGNKVVTEETLRRIDIVVSNIRNSLTCGL